LSKPKILFVLFQTEQRANGGINSVFEIINGLNEFEPIILTQLNTEKIELIRQFGYNVMIRRIPSAKGFKKYIQIIKYNYWIYKWIKNQSIKTVHINDIQSLTYTIFGLKLAGLKPIFNLRGVFEPGKKYGLKWRILNFSNRIILLSNEMKTTLYDRLPLWNKAQWCNKINAIYSIVDHNKYCRNSTVSDYNSFELWDRSKLTHHILFIAAFNVLKGQLEFIKKALPGLVNEKITVHFVGDMDNEYAGKCLQLVKHMDLSDYCTFHGFRSDVELFYKTGDLTVIPSVREGLARCMIESLSCGTPVVSFDVCSAKEILIQNDCGIVVGHGDYEGLVSEIINLLSNPSKMQRLGENGYMVSRKLFNRAQIIKQYENIYFESQIQ